MTLEKAVVDAGRKNFAHGQIYVAISRVKTIDIVRFRRTEIYQKILG